MKALRNYYKLGISKVLFIGNITNIMLTGSFISGSQFSRQVFLLCLCVLHIFPDLKLESFGFQCFRPSGS